MKALACELPADSDVPLAKWSWPDLAIEAWRRGIVESVSASTVRRWLSTDALKPWQHRSRIFARDLHFAVKAARRRVGRSDAVKRCTCPQARSTYGDVAHVRGSTSPASLPVAVASWTVPDTWPWLQSAGGVTRLCATHETMIIHIARPSPGSRGTCGVGGCG